MRPLVGRDPAMGRDPRGNGSCDGKPRRVRRRPDMTSVCPGGVGCAGGAGKRSLDPGRRGGHLLARMAAIATVAHCVGGAESTTAAAAAGIACKGVAGIVGASVLLGSTQRSAPAAFGQCAKGGLFATSVGRATGGCGGLRSSGSVAGAGGAAFVSTNAPLLMRRDGEVGWGAGCGAAGRHEELAAMLERGGMWSTRVRGGGGVVSATLDVLARGTSEVRAGEEEQREFDLEFE
ncbi:hypothetical protein T484DRAFT_1888409, partial [Baffinella frigidus]